MVPIHDTDLADERWKQGEWKHYEFWEEVETRFKRKKKLWIVIVLVLFFILSAYPVVQERIPKWRALRAARELARTMSLLRRQAIVEKAIFRLRFPDPTQPRYIIEKLRSCQDVSGPVVQKGLLIDEIFLSQLAIMNHEMGQQFGFNKLIEQYCFDPLRGNSTFPLELEEAGFAFIPVKDLAKGRSDRIAVLLLQGYRSEITFNF